MDYNKIMEELENCLGLEKPVSRAINPKRPVKTATESYNEVEAELADTLEVKTPKIRKIDKMDDAEEEKTPKEAFIDSAKGYLDFLCEDGCKPDEAQEIIEKELNEVLYATEKDELADNKTEESSTEALYGIEEISRLTKLCKQIGIETFGDLERFLKEEGQGKEVLQALEDYLNNELGSDFKIKDQTGLSNLDKIHKQLGVEDRKGSTNKPQLDKNSLTAKILKRLDDTPANEGLSNLDKIRALLNSDKIDTAEEEVKGELAEESFNKGKLSAKEFLDSQYEEMKAKMLSRYESLCGNTKKTASESVDEEPKLNEKALNKVSMEFGYNVNQLKEIIKSALKEGVI